MKFKNTFKFLNNKSAFMRFNNKRGFTLIELLVVFAISAFISATVMTNFGDFTSNTEFNNVALDMALTLREAQVYGMNGKEALGGFGSAYGVVFDTSKQNLFTLDTFNGTGSFYAQSDIVLKKTFSINDGFQIKNICYSNGVSCSSVPDMALVFKRPNPDAHIYIKIFSGGTFFGGTYSKGEITIERTSDGKTKTINITNTGQIYVN